jgi:hypothetical protein
MTASQLAKDQLVVTFDSPVWRADLHAQSVRVQLKTRHGAVDDDKVALACWCDLEVTVHGGRVDKSCDATSRFESSRAQEVTAVRITLPDLDDLVQHTKGLELRVLIEGDFIRGRHRVNQKSWRALDADHLPRADAGMPPQTSNDIKDVDWLQPQDDRVTGDGVDGGTFESYFSITSQI